MVHVVDVTHPNAPEQCHTVEQTLAGLHVLDKPRITALNKIDLLTDRPEEFAASEEIHRLGEQFCQPGENTVLISAATGFGVDGLLDRIGSMLRSVHHPATP